MTIRSIIFSATMIRSLLDGRKTQTRRLLRIPAHLDGDEAQARHFQGVGPGLAAPMRDNPEHRCGVFPRYAIGDRLWVRETWIVEALGRIYWITRAYATGSIWRLRMAENEDAHEGDVLAVGPLNTCRGKANRIEAALLADEAAGP